MSLHVVDPVTPAMAERHRREEHREQAAMHVYEALRLPTMPRWYDLSSRSRNRFRNAISMAEASIDMRQVAQECK